MRVLGIAGYSGSGKTTLLVRLLPALRAHGLVVATVKHTHHRFDPWPEGHPAAAWRAAGAREVLWTDPRTRLLQHELRDENEPPFEALYGLIGPVDLLLIEGYKFSTLEKIEVHRRETGAPLLAAHDPLVIAMATDAGHRPTALPGGRDLPIFSVDDVTAIAAFIAARGRAATATPEVKAARHAAIER